ncbi:MAG: phosphate ABC transporter ATP-binding protein PstB [Salinivirgaceae bacterium]|jgi:phosphate transport system ATP-binding protein|nr:phosphate ABC transporter ATP-binding protein PstB [Salinivirgaceae bacterium]
MKNDLIILPSAQPSFFKSMGSDIINTKTSSNEPVIESEVITNNQEITSVKKSEKKEYQILVKNVNVFYSEFQALKDINMEVSPKSITAFIGPSGCGKSTFLRTLNRMNDYIDSFKIKGDIFINGKNIYNEKIILEQLRKDVGMVFQKPNPFPKSILENAIYGLRIQGIKDKSFLAERAEDSLKQVGLWDEVKDNLKKSALALSGGQQQRLCIARTLAVEPEIILMDEPTSALDPISTGRIEELIFELKKNYTIVIVTHNMQQASRISDNTAFFYLGELVEQGKTNDIFTNPKYKRTENYITGRFG